MPTSTCTPRASSQTTTSSSSRARWSPGSWGPSAYRSARTTTRESTGSATAWWPVAGPNRAAPSRRSRSRTRRWALGVLWHAEEDGRSPVLAALTAAAREREQVASVIEVVEPATERVMAEVPRAGIEETDAAVAAAKAAFPAWRAVAPGERAARAARARRRPRVEPRRAGDARGAQRRQADLRRPRRDRDGGRDLPLLRRRAGAPARQDDPGGRRGRRHLPRAARRRRPDHALELPAGDRLLEGGTRPRGRQHRRAEAGGADAVDRAGDGADRPPRPGSQMAS